MKEIPISSVAGKWSGSRGRKGFDVFPTIILVNIVLVGRSMLGKVGGRWVLALRRI